MLKSKVEKEKYQGNKVERFVALTEIYFLEHSFTCTLTEFSASMRLAWLTVTFTVKLSFLPASSFPIDFLSFDLVNITGHLVRMLYYLLP